MSRVDPVRVVDVSAWRPPLPDAAGAALARDLEDGRILHFERLAFVLTPSEQRFLDARWSNGVDKNVSFDPAAGALAGAAGDARDLAELAEVIARFREAAVGLVVSLFPRYEAALRPARTSYRPVRVEGRVASWKRDDSRLHVDAFPSRPTRGERTLRVFANVSPSEPRVWRIGEPFEDVARRWLPRIRRPLAGSAYLLHALGVTTPRRSEYDHVMLKLHDAMKRDTTYQQSAARTTVSFPPASVWICFSDQVAHAAVSGCFAFEQTLHLPVAALYDPASSPLRILERLLDRPLV